MSDKSSPANTERRPHPGAFFVRVTELEQVAVDRTDQLVQEVGKTGSHAGGGKSKSPRKQPRDAIDGNATGKFA